MGSDKAEWTIAMELKTNPLSRPAPPMPPLSPEVAMMGPPVTPFERLQLMSAAIWENVVHEWVYSLGQHARVEKYAGTGDTGLDVVAFDSETDEDPWDNYQCKHYDHPLAPSDMWTELGKLVYYTFIGEYSVPRRYYFVAPQGAGTALSKLLHKPEQVRSGLLNEWDRRCRKKITSTREIVLDDELKRHIDTFDFRIVTAVSPHTIIDDLRKTRVFPSYFGGGLPERGPIPDPPPEVEPNEMQYVRALLDAYEDRLEATLKAPADLVHGDLGEHFVRSRREFYSAESLKEFSRDNVSPGTFESLLEEVYSGVVDVEQAQHSNAYERVLAVVKQAKAMQFTSNSLVFRTHTTDKGGMCHQLANELKLRWRR